MFASQFIAKKQIANYITCGRIILAKVAIICYLLSAIDSSIVYTLRKDVAISGMVLAAGIIFVIAAFTDALDGYCARKYGHVTTLGKILDPVADKILVNGCLIVLTAYNQMVPAWLVIIFIIRDLWVTLIRITALQNGRIIAANSIGKWKTACELIGIIVITFGFWNYHPSTSAPQKFSTNYFLVQNGFLLIGGGLAIISLFQYQKNKK